MATINGTSANNSLYGTRYADTIRGHGGNDYANGQGGNDWIDGGIGEDKVEGGAGNDTVRGGAGRDFVGGGTGDDLLYGDDGDDYLWGDVGFDQLFGGAGNDRMLAGEGTNDMSGGDGSDTLVLELYGEAKDGQSEYYGGAGFDTAHVISTGTIDIDPYDEMDLAAEAIATVRFNDAGTGYLGFTSEPWNETPGAPNNTIRLYSGFGVVGSRAAKRAPSKALPRHLALCTNSKRAR